MAEHFYITPPFVYHNMAQLWTTCQLSGFSLKEIAAKAQVSVRAIRNYENGEQFPSRKTYNKIAAILGWEIWR